MQDERKIWSARRVTPTVWVLSGATFGMLAKDLDILRDRVQAEPHIAVAVAAVGFALAIGLVWFEGRVGHPREK